MKSLLNISLTAVCPAALALAKGTNDTVPLARIMGEATDIKSSRNGETILGDFRAVNLETGEEFKSSVVYLPRGLHEKVIVAMDKDEKSGTVNHVRFAFDIWAEPEINRESYNIGFKDLLENPEKPDPLAAFMAGVATSSDFGKTDAKK